MNLSKFPRKRYTVGQTPIEFLKNLSEHFNGPQIYMKRDDLLGLAAGGNKTRKLEFLMADAIAQGADTILTCGAVQSNHCRLTLAAACKEGLKCQLILEERVPDSYHVDASGNNYLFRLMGVEDIRVVKGGSNMAEELNNLAAELTAQGRKPYIIPGGGSNTIGARGYVSCAQELIAQSFEMGVDFTHIVVPSGSAGTHSGVLVGLRGMNVDTPLLGISVSRPQSTQQELVHGLATRTAVELCPKVEISKDDVVVYDGYVGKGYSLPTDGMIEAVQLLARKEAILMDPVYSGKTMAGMIDLIRQGYFKKEDKVLFLHTGGSPALYAYCETTLSDLEG